MEHIASELDRLIDEYTPAIRTISEDNLLQRPSPSKWSKKEILGHLIDSAQSNIRRFVVAQYEDTPVIVYNQDKWIAIANYQQYDTASLITLWNLLNKHIIQIWRNTDKKMAQRMCMTQQLHSIEWLATDYILHLRHHMHQLLGLEPVSYP